MPPHDAPPQFELPVLGQAPPSVARRYDWRWLPVGMLLCGLGLLIGLGLQILSHGRNPRALPLMLGGSLSLIGLILVIRPAPRRPFALRPDRTVLTARQLPAFPGLRLTRLEVRIGAGPTPSRAVRVQANAVVLDAHPKRLLIELHGDRPQERASLSLRFTPRQDGGPSPAAAEAQVSFQPIQALLLLAPAADVNSPTLPPPVDAAESPARPAPNSPGSPPATETPTAR